MRTKKSVLITLIILVLITTLACTIGEQFSSFFDSGSPIVDEYSRDPLDLSNPDRWGPTRTPQWGPVPLPAEPPVDIEPQEVEPPLPNPPEEEPLLPNPPNEVTTEIEAPEQSIAGTWAGTAQWLCTNNPACQVTLDILADGTLSSTVACPSLTLSASGTWSLSDNLITLIFDGYAEIWSGTVTDDGISGAITGGGEDCDGVWSVSK